MGTSHDTDRRIHAARRTKAAKLLGAIASYNATHKPPIEVGTLHELDDTAWNLLATIAGCNPPSHDTRRMVRDLMVVERHADPFVGVNGEKR